MERDELSPLLEADQLITEKNAGHVFDGWDTLPPRFPPTYKFPKNEFSRPENS